MISKAITFVKEAKIELSKVTWLTKQQTIRYTLLVIVISLAVAAFLGTLDYFFGNMVEKYLFS